VTLGVTRLMPHFAARVEGVDIARPVMQRTTVSGDLTELAGASSRTA
jgi:hypothetical protein